MTDTPTDNKGPTPPKTLPFSQSGSDHAPFLYFEDAPAFGHLNGIIRITLEASRVYTGSDDVVVSDRVAVAHLRMNIRAALSLKSAIEGALLLASSPPSGSKN